MSNPTTYFGWQMPEPTDLVTDLPADFEVFGQAVDTDFQDLLGGTTGQLLSKTSGNDLDFTWVTPNAGDITGVTAGTGISGGGTSGDVTVTNSMATAIDAKGDLIAGTGADTFSKLTVGANGTTLVADSSEATGLKWQAPAGGAGNMAQIATGTLSGASVVISSLTTYTDILVFLFDVTNSTANGNVFLRLNATSSNHDNRGMLHDSAGNNYLVVGNVNSSDFNLSSLNVTRTSSSNNFVAKLTNCKNPGFTDIDVKATFNSASSGSQGFFSTKGIYTASEAVSSITLRNSGGNWAGGTYIVFGA